MTQSKTDPRVLRTRKLIMDSFIELSGEKEFKDITVKDITVEAMINRATFYYHFDDIYDLLEKALSEVLLVNLDCDAYQNKELNEEALVNIFKAITDFQKSLSNRCHRGYEDTIARIIREQLEIIFYKMLLKRHHNEENGALKITAVMLSWGMYGASVEWRRASKQPPEEFIKLAIPYIMAGIDFRSSDEQL
ncbi:TetR/AcrR family transcriptional regulator [Lederbergia galactosidilytica]|uniref:TetR family transcriptional regulator n=1 Tax=Lederbergia galactosidilytica TaxID=217031 RepID=A0A177ZIU2_9BACI|nr:TetR/AcrR family transcriptional regulator [Lederbergia galactosidilytica]KRG15154.1 TetR family transcriptional regulator [Virgibacillus soli]MBP1913201.1 AcrR family transcriptional regulator [Lederbergia galactosidilytica]OAK67881.1 TetR family transcriptional regulator [Lederbergia galactosidilytica]